MLSINYIRVYYKGKDNMGRKRGEYYINPEELKQDIQDFKDTRVISNELGEKLIKIAIIITDFNKVLIP